MKKLFIACMALIVASTTMNAQTDNNIFTHMGVGVEVGTTGIGVELSAPITDYVNVRAGVNVMPTIKVKDIGVDISANKSDWDKAKEQITELKTKYEGCLSAADETKVNNFYNKYINEPLPDDVLIDGKISMVNFKLLFDVYPIKSSSFHVTAGFYAGTSKIVEAYTTNCQAQFNALTEYNSDFAGTTMTASKTINGVTYSDSYTFHDKFGAKIGNENLYPNGDQARAFMKVGGFKPYLGIGFGRAVPQKHRLAFNFDLGVQFWGTPKIYLGQPDGDKEIDLDNLDDDWDALKFVGKLKVYPCMSFRLTGRIF